MTRSYKNMYLVAHSGLVNGGNNDAVDAAERGGVSDAHKALLKHVSFALACGSSCACSMEVMRALAPEAEIVLRDDILALDTRDWDDIYQDSRKRYLKTAVYQWSAELRTVIDRLLRVLLIPLPYEKPALLVLHPALLSLYLMAKHEQRFSGIVTISHYVFRYSISDDGDEIYSWTAR